MMVLNPLYDLDISWEVMHWDLYGSWWYSAMASF